MEQQRGGTKIKDKSLQGTTTLVRVIPVIKKNQSKQSQDNVRSISKGGHEAKIVCNKYVPDHHKKKRQATTTERRDRRIKN